MVPSLGIPGELQEQRSNEGKQRAEEIVERIQKVIFAGRPAVRQQSGKEEREARENAAKSKHNSRQKS